MGSLWCSALVAAAAMMAVVADATTTGARMSIDERNTLREEARDMFYHAYYAYMENAYPADELMPLSCKGRYRGVTPTRGDMDDVLGNFSLTLVDSLDTLVVLGDMSEFEDAVKLVIKDLTFETDIVVSVFETNIRMLGGLLSAHVFASELQTAGDFFGWYRGELLTLAHDLGRRLLPAFNTSTGIPHSRVNLKYGLQGLQNSRETCTACAGTMILEMAALSRLTGEGIFEQKAHKAMNTLWKIRNRGSDLMGTVLNVHSGDWIRKDSGVGAGIDSYYEYCLKAYILLGDETYLARFYRHYNAVMKYISRGPMMFDVHMHRPDMQSRHYMDALLAFWPGLQVLLGDVKPAVETHEMLYQVMQRHTFIPEAFTADFQVHWGQHPLRPEFIESTYFLHRATGDDHYLWVARAALKSLQKYTRVPCGYAAVNDVRTRIHEDRMDSYVLAETFKYLYMIFSYDADLPINLQDYVLTTEAHFLPLSLSDTNNNASDFSLFDDDEIFYYSRTCLNSANFLPETVRRPLKNMLDCPSNNPASKLTAKHFKPWDPQHMHTLADMGISILTLSDGRVQLLHTVSMAKSSRDAKDGLVFMREMAELSKQSALDNDVSIKLCAVRLGTKETDRVLLAFPAEFGPELKGEFQIAANAVYAKPAKVCGQLFDVDAYQGKIVIAKRGDCTFADKVRRLQNAGAVGVIIIDNVAESSYTSALLFVMYGDGVNDIKIPSVFLFSDDAKTLKGELTKDPSMTVTLVESKSATAPSSDQVDDKSAKNKLQQAINEFQFEQALLEKLTSEEPFKKKVGRDSLIKADIGENLKTETGEDKLSARTTDELLMNFLRLQLSNTDARDNLLLKNLLSLKNPGITTDTQRELLQFIKAMVSSTDRKTSKAPRDDDDVVKTMERIDEEMRSKDGMVVDRLSMLNDILNEVKADSETDSGENGN